MFATINQLPLEKPMHKNILACLAILTLFSRLSAFGQQDTNASAAGTNAVATTNAPDNTPKPDPSGRSTGASGDAASADTTAFVVAAPTELSADDKKDPAKVKDYNDKKKAFDEYTAQAKLEPLAVRLSD